MNHFQKERALTSAAGVVAVVERTVISGYRNYRQDCEAVRSRQKSKFMESGDLDILGVGYPGNIKPRNEGLAILGLFSRG